MRCHSPQHAHARSSLDIVIFAAMRARVYAATLPLISDDIDATLLLFRAIIAMLLRCHYLRIIA